MHWLQWNDWISLHAKTNPTVYHIFQLYDPVTLISHEHHSVSIHQQLDTLFSSLFRLITKKTPNPCINGHLWVESTNDCRSTDKGPEREIKCIGLFGDRGHQSPYSPYKPCNHNKGPVIWKAFPCHGLIMWWRSVSIILRLVSNIITCLTEPSGEWVKHLISYKSQAQHHSGRPLLVTPQ